MFEFEARALQAGDIFTQDQGQTWYQAVTSRSANQDKKRVVNAFPVREGVQVGPTREFIFNADDNVIVK